MTRRRFLLSVIAALYFGILIGLTFAAATAPLRQLWLWPILAFVPVGLLLLLLLGRRRWWAALGFGLLGAAWIEAAQSIWMPAGFAEVVDVVWAGVGVLIGVVVGVFASARPDRSASHESPRVVTQASNRETP